VHVNIAYHHHHHHHHHILALEEEEKKILFPVGKYNIDIQNAYKHQIFITAYRRLPESLYKLSMLATYNRPT